MNIVCDAPKCSPFFLSSQLKKGKILLHLKQMFGPSYFVSTLIWQWSLDLRKILGVTKIFLKWRFFFYFKDKKTIIIFYKLILLFRNQLSIFSPKMMIVVHCKFVYKRLLWIFNWAKLQIAMVRFHKILFFLKLLIENVKMSWNFVVFFINSLSTG